MKTTSFLFVFLAYACLFGQNASSSVYLNILGTVQDGGAPHIGCTKKCCLNLSSEEIKNRKITALEVYDTVTEKSLLFEATPDIVSQWASMHFSLCGIFLTHAHIGHYSGLLQLGREALGAKNIPVYTLPKMRSFLKTNAPWSQLVSLKNITLKKLENKKKVRPFEKIEVTPLRVPHRDEFSETVGYIISGPQKTVLFVPDIDKWSLWEESLIHWLQKVDIAFIDATFFSAKEVNYRPLSEIPHPLVQETISYLEAQPKRLKNKVYFIHMNHTNPLLNEDSKATEWVLKHGFHIARVGQQFNL
ncbi:MAG: MBL fold metallo-hydrolase [Flavobacteriaceae bacterium]|nr:MBL fold metallo-hydrolase [Flavobacteriaceae bacterium]